MIHLSIFQRLRNLNYWWTFGGILTFCLVVQIITGIVLAMHYVPHADFAFASVEHIMRDVNYGWLLRYVHANGGSMFFFAVFIHMFRGIYLRFLQGTARSALDPRRHYFHSYDRGGFLGLRLTLGADELLGGDRYYKFVWSDPAGRRFTGNLVVGRLFR